MTKNGPLCLQCEKPAAIIYGAIQLCASCYSIRISQQGLSANGSVWDNVRRTFRAPTAEEAEQQRKIRSSITSPLAPVETAPNTGPGFAGTGASNPAPSGPPSGFGSTLHAEERERLDRAIQASNRIAP